MKLLMWVPVVRVVALWFCEMDIKETLWPTVTIDKERFHCGIGLFS